MSIELIAELYNRRSVDPKLQRVLLCLCDAANDSGVCWPSVGRIAWKLECSEATVQRAIRELKIMGVVTVSPRGGRSNVYRVDLSLLPHKPPYRDETDTPLQNDTPLQSVPPTPIQNVPPTPLQNDGGPPLQNDTLNRKGNRKGNRKEEPSVAKPAKKSTRKTPVHDMPPEWKPKEATRKWARDKGVDDKTIDYQAEKFTDYHLSSAKQFADWDRAFQTWIRNGIEWERIIPKKILPQQSLENMDTPTDNHESARERMIREAKEREQNGY